MKTLILTPQTLSSLKAIAAPRLKTLEVSKDTLTKNLAMVYSHFYLSLSEEYASLLDLIYLADVKDAHIKDVISFIENDNKRKDIAALYDELGVVQFSELLDICHEYAFMRSIESEALMRLCDGLVVVNAPLAVEVTTKLHNKIYNIKPKSLMGKLKELFC